MFSLWCYNHILSKGSLLKRNIKPSITKGLVIDAGNSGSRIHIYTWKPRYFKTNTPSISYPLGNEQWSTKITPAISSLSIDLTFDKISAHLLPLIQYAMKVMTGPLKDRYSDIPIYFYATSGMRELDSRRRDRIVAYVRRFLSNKALSPFYFQDDFARILSGNNVYILSHLYHT